MHILLIDLSPQSVALALLRSDPKEAKTLPTLIYCQREYISYKAKPESSQIEAGVRSLLSLLVAKAVKAAEGKIDRVYIIHSLLWSYSFSTEIRFDQEQAFKLSRDMLQDLAEKQAKEPAGMMLIRKNVSHVRVNGYKVANPWGLETKRIEASLNLTYIDRRMTELARTEIGRHTKAPLEHVTVGESAAKAFQHSGGGENALMAHIDGEMTEIIFWRGSGISSSISVPYGASTLCRAMSESSDIGPEVAFGHINAALKGERSLGKKEKPAFEGAMSAWRKLVFEAMHELSPEGVIPHQIHVVSLPQYQALSLALCDAREIGRWSGQEHMVTGTWSEPEHRELYHVAKGVERDPLIAIALISFLS